MQQQETCLRFADYFFRIGISEDTDISKSKVIFSEDAAFDKQHPILNRYEPETIYRYPKLDYSENEKFPLYTPLVPGLNLVLFS
jgi:hypothetical protein